MPHPSLESIKPPARGSFWERLLAGAEQAPPLPMPHVVSRFHTYLADEPSTPGTWSVSWHVKVIATSNASQCIEVADRPCQYSSCSCSRLVEQLADNVAVIQTLVQVWEPADKFPIDRRPNNIHLSGIPIGKVDKSSTTGNPDFGI